MGLCTSAARQISFRKAGSPYSGPRGFHECLERGPGRARLLCPVASAAPASGGRRCGLPVSSTRGGGVSGDLSSQSARLGGPAWGQPSPTLLEPPQGLPWPPRLEGCPGPSAGKASLLPLSSSPFPGGGAKGGRGVGLGPCPAAWPRCPERLGVWAEAISPGRHLHASLYGVAAKRSGLKNTAPGQSRTELVTNVNGSAQGGWKDDGAHSEDGLALWPRSVGTDVRTEAATLETNQSVSSLTRALSPPGRFCPDGDRVPSGVHQGCVRPGPRPLPQLFPGTPVRP